MRPDERNVRSGLRRRSFLALGAGTLGAAGAVAALGGRALADEDANASDSSSQPILPNDLLSGSEPFWGTSQGGILTPLQDHTYFTAFDVQSSKLSDVVSLLQSWTAVAARLCSGNTAESVDADSSGPAGDTGEALGLGPAHLTLTFGFGAGLFVQNGVDRFGLQSARPAALVDLPVFPGDELDDATSGGDLTVQACANDPQVAFHAVRQLAREAAGVATVRWTQAGYSRASAVQGAPRNLLGFKDGTGNPDTSDANQMSQVLWVGSEGPDWMTGGTYLVVRRIRTTIEHWDTQPMSVQEDAIGRQKLSGAPLGGTNEGDAPNYDALSDDGRPTIPLTAHMRLATAVSNNGAIVLRRPYSYNNGVDTFTERWPPWRQGLEYDVGLLFCAYQRDPTTGFIPIMHNLALSDALNQYVTHVGSVLVAIPPGASGDGHWIGEGLFGS